jgi:hypothetical protein
MTFPSSLNSAYYAVTQSEDNDLLAEEDVELQRNDSGGPIELDNERGRKDVSENDQLPYGVFRIHFCRRDEETCAMVWLSGTPMRLVVLLEFPKAAKMSKRYYV